MLFRILIKLCGHGKMRLLPLTSGIALRLMDLSRNRTRSRFVHQAGLVVLVCFATIEYAIVTCGIYLGSIGREATRDEEWVAKPVDGREAERSHMENG